MGFKSYFRVVSGDRYSTVDANARPLRLVQTNSRSTATSPLKKHPSDSTLQSKSSKAGKGKGTRYGDAATLLNEYIMTYTYTKQGLGIPRHLVDEVRNWTHDEQRLLDRAIMVMEYRKRLDMGLLSFSVFKIIRESLIGPNDLFISFKGLSTVLYSKAPDQKSSLTVSEVPGIIVMHQKFDVETKCFAGKQKKLNELLAIADKFQKAENDRLADIKAAKKAFIRSKLCHISLFIGHVTDISLGKSRFMRIKHFIRKKIFGKKPSPFDVEANSVGFNKVCRDHSAEYAALMGYAVVDYSCVFHRNQTSRVSRADSHRLRILSKLSLQLILLSLDLSLGANLLQRSNFVQ
jgi:hypothetical protein